MDDFEKYTLDNLTKEVIEKLKSSEVDDYLKIAVEFHKRGLKIRDIKEVTLVFRDNGWVHVHGSFMTTSPTSDMAIM